MDVKGGRILWHHDVVKDFGGRQARLSWDMPSPFWSMGRW